VSICDDMISMMNHIYYIMKKIENTNDMLGKLHGVTSLGERGQIVIPKKLRDSLDLKKGDQFVVVEKHGGIMLLPSELMENFISNITSQLKEIKK
jgi:AbrB family looped-hinge helix DNA binding protein